MLKSSRKVVGCKQVLRGLSEATIRCVIVAEDAENELKSALFRAASEMNARVLIAPSMEWLGRQAGIDVGAATVGFEEFEG